MAKLTVEQARKIVLERYPDAELDEFIDNGKTLFTIITPQPGYRFQRIRIAENEVTDDAAWLSAASHLKEGEEK